MGSAIPRKRRQIWIGGESLPGVHLGTTPTTPTTETPSEGSVTGGFGGGGSGDGLWTGFARAVDEPVEVVVGWAG